MTIRLRLIMCVMVVVCCVSCTPGPADPEISSTTQVDDAPAIDRASDPSETSADGPPVGGDTPLQEVAGGDSLIGWDALDIGMQADVVYRPFFLQNNPPTSSLIFKNVRSSAQIHNLVDFHST